MMLAEKLRACDADQWDISKSCSRNDRDLAKNTILFVEFRPLPLTDHNCESRSWIVEKNFHSVVRERSNII